MELLTPGQMRKLNRVSEKALRVYEEKGLLVPCEVNEQTGHRHYDIRQSTKLDMITQLQQIGLSLNEIAEISEKKDVAYLYEMVKAQTAVIEEQMRALSARYGLSKEIMGSCETYLHQVPYDQILFEKFEDRPIIKFETPSAEALGLENPENTLSFFETVLRHTKQRIIDSGLPLTLYHNICSLMSTELLREDSGAYITHTFAFVHGPELADLANDVLPGGYYLTLYSNNAYDENERSLTRERFARLLDYAKAKGLTPGSFAYGESVCRWPHMLDEGNDIMHRLCLPVQ